VTEQRYKAVLAVIGDGRTVGEVARDWGTSRRTMHRYLAPSPLPLQPALHSGDRYSTSSLTQPSRLIPGIGPRRRAGFR